MTTENSQKSKKYVVTKLLTPGESHLERLIEKQLCRCDTLEECAEFIVNNDEYWYNCRYGKELLNLKLADRIIKFKSLKSDFS